MLDSLLWWSCHMIQKQFFCRQTEHKVQQHCDLWGFKINNNNIYQLKWKIFIYHRYWLLYWKFHKCWWHLETKQVNTKWRHYLIPLWLHAGMNYLYRKTHKNIFSGFKQCLHQNATRESSYCTWHFHTYSLEKKKNIWQSFKVTPCICHGEWREPWPSSSHFYMHTFSGAVFFIMLLLSFSCFWTDDNAIQLNAN